jgi:hypothetical protein
MATKPRSPRPPKGSLPGKLRAFFRSYTEGVEAKDVRRLLDRDAPRAIRMLVGEPPPGETAARGRVARFFSQARLLFLGISYRLSPPRRFVFGVSVLFFFLGLVRFDFNLDQQGSRLRIDGSPLFLGLAFAGVTLLLVLELVERVLVRDELQVARQLQQDLLPASPPKIPGFLAAQACGTANEIGGDYLHFAELPDRRWVLAIGDASGHGMAAGLLMALADATLRTLLELTPEPEQLVGRLNRRLCHTGDRRAFMSLFYGILDPATGELHAVCAGHPYPVKVSAAGVLEELGSGGLPLGIREDLQLASIRARLEPGDLLLLYSDGLPEAVNAAGESFGFERMKSLAKPGGTPSAIVDRILAAHRQHLGEEPLTDDWTVLALRRHAATAPSAPQVPAPAGSATTALP